MKKCLIVIDENNFEDSVVAAVSNSKIWLAGGQRWLREDVEIVCWMRRNSHGL